MIIAAIKLKTLNLMTNLNNPTIENDIFRLLLLLLFLFCASNISQKRERDTETE